MEFHHEKTNTESPRIKRRIALRIARFQKLHEAAERAITDCP